MFFVFHKKKIIWISGLGGCILLLIAWALFFNQKDQKIYDYVIAERTNVVRTVSVTGKVEPSNRAELAFEVGGRGLSVSVDVGDMISKGDVLVELETDDA